MQVYCKIIHNTFYKKTFPIDFILKKIFVEFYNKIINNAFNTFKLFCIKIISKAFHIRTKKTPNTFYNKDISMYFIIKPFPNHFILKSFLMPFIMR